MHGRDERMIQQGDWVSGQRADVELCDGAEGQRAGALSDWEETSVSFMKPEYQVDRIDTDEIRRKIQSISYADWKKLGFSKGSLHYMKKNAESEKLFSLNQHVVERLMQWDQLKKTLSV